MTVCVEGTFGQVCRCRIYYCDASNPKVLSNVRHYWSLSLPCKACISGDNLAMQRATYLSQLYESIANIPPDIQQCLLTIAQYGCDPSQLDRWYGIVRQHYGVSWTQPAQDQTGLQYILQGSNQTELPHSSHSGSNDTSLAMLSPSVSPKLEEYADPLSASNGTGTMAVEYVPAVQASSDFSAPATALANRPLLPKAVPITCVVASSTKRPTRIGKRRKASRNNPSSSQPPVRSDRPVTLYRNDRQVSWECGVPYSGELPSTSLDNVLLPGQTWQQQAEPKGPRNVAESSWSRVKYPCNG